MKKKILTLILTLVLGITTVDAAYKVTSTANNMIGKDAEDYPIISSGKGDAHVGSGESFTLTNGSETLNGYCIDPGIKVPTNVEFVKGDISEIGEHVEALKYICQQTKGKETLRIAMIKAYSINVGLGHVGASVGSDGVKVYKGLGLTVNGTTNPSTTMFNPAYTGGLDAKAILQNAVNLKDKSAGSDIINLSAKNGKITLTTNVPGTIKLNNPTDYEMYIYGAKQSDAYNVVVASGKTATIEIEIKVKDCVDGTVYQPDITFEYEEKDLAVSESSVGYYVYKNNTAGYQRLITCEDGESGHDCKDGICTKTEKVEITCDAEVCEEPKVEQGSELCGDDGDTIISVTETPNKLEYIGSSCFAELPLATETILGHSNDYCEIRCSESYKLELPGPDATKGDNEVKINAGSYFTIATEDESGKSLMYDETTYTCYGKMDFSKYQSDLNTIKNNVATYYNAMTQIAARISILSTLKPNAEGICPATEKYYDTVEVDGSGKFVIKTNGGKDGLGEAACTEGAIEDERKLQANKFKEKYEALESYIKIANEQIDVINAKWDECSGWSIQKLNDIYNDSAENCSAQIDFDYASEDICDIKVVVDEIDYIESADIETHTSKATSEKVYNGKIDATKDPSDWNNAGTTEAYTYINQQATITTKYKFDNDFTVEYATGEISCDAKTGDEYSDVIHGFPVSIESQQGLHEYKYTYSNIGHNFDTGTKCSGRFDDIIKSKDNHKCNYDVNNCDDCEVKCDPEGNCDMDFCDGDCQVACVGAGCILDANAGFLATYRTVSLNETFTVATVLSSEPAKMLAMATEKNYSSNTDFAGSNWSTEKGKETSGEIAKLGESIYDKEPEYSITLTPAVINEIKKYNEAQEDFEKSEAQGYLNNTLKCTNVNGTNYGQCISTFVHDDKWSFNILDEATSSDQVVIEIEGNKAVFKSYLGDTKAFTGPAWK